MKDLVTRARAAMNLLLLLSVGMAWQTHNVQRETNFEALIKKEVVEIAEFLGLTVHHPIRNRVYSDYSPNRGPSAEYVSAFHKNLSDLGRRNRIWTMMLRDAGVTYRDINPVILDTRAFYSALSNILLDEDLNTIPLEEVLLNVDALAKLSPIFGFPLRRPVDLGEDSLLLKESGRKIGWVQRGWRHYRKVANNRQWRLRTQMVRYQLNPNHTLGELKERMESKILVPILEQNLTITLALQVTAIFQIGAILYLLSAVLAMRTLSTRQNTCLENDWIFFQSDLGSWLGGGWLLSPALLGTWLCTKIGDLLDPFDLVRIVFVLFVYLAIGLKTLDEIRMLNRELKQSQN